MQRDHVLMRKPGASQLTLHSAVTGFTSEGPLAFYGFWFWMEAKDSNINNYHILSTYYMPNTVLRALHASSHKSSVRELLSLRIDGSERLSNSCKSTQLVPKPKSV